LDRSERVRIPQSDPKSKIQNRVRRLIKTPGFSLVAIFTLALGIAGNVVIFSVFNGLFLRPFPFAEAEQLVNLDEVAPRWNLEYTGLAYNDFCDWREGNQSFTAMGVYSDTRYNVATRGQPERVQGGRASHDLLSTLGIRPLLGRAFTAEEDQPGQGRVVMVGHGFWLRRWGGAPDVIGQSLTLDSVSHTIIGVLPLHLGPLERMDVLVPLARTREGGGWYLTGVGRLKPGVSAHVALQDLTRIHKAQIPTRPVNEITAPRLTPLRDRMFGDYRSVTYVLLAAVGVVWLIACGNVAALMLARGLGRTKEISIRMALGASRWVIARDVLGESLLLSALGGVLGIAAGLGAMKLILALFPDRFPAWIDFGADGRFLVFCCLSTALTAVCFGWLPAAQMTARVDLRGALQASSNKSTGSARQRRGLSGLVVAEIALALVLLVNAGLLFQAFRAMQRVDPGFRAENVLTYDLALARAKYTNEQTVAFFEEHLAQVLALPGVKAASATTLVPLSGHSGTFFEAEGAPPKRPDEPNPVVLWRRVFPGYAEAIGLTLLSGKFISDENKHGAGVNVVVVNESFAKLNWPGQEAVGKRIRFPSDKNPWMTVIGVVRDEKHYGLDQPMRPGVFLPYHAGPERQMTLVVRTVADPLPVLPAIRTLVRQQDPELPVFEVKTMTERVENSMWLRRSYSWLFGFFAVIALTMALGGVYGVISYSVGQRTNEIGIRMALGAQRQDVQRLVLSHGLFLAGLGSALGLAGAFGLSQLTRTLLFGVSPVEPFTLLTVPLLLVGVTMLASWLPARRATRVDPLIALRAE
jgi:predicted permease